MLIRINANMLIDIKTDKALLQLPAAWRTRYIAKVAGRCFTDARCSAHFEQISRTYSTFIHSVVQKWSGLSDSVVCEICDKCAQFCNSRVKRHLISAAAESSLTFFYAAVNHWLAL